MTEGDVWFNTQKTTLHIEKGRISGRGSTAYYWCGLTGNKKHTRYRLKWNQIPDNAPFCRRCVKIKMQWAWKK